MIRNTAKIIRENMLPLEPDAAQRVASDPAASVWVAASAGSGKTKVLADRVIRLLLSGVRPQRILCLTFTRAAAAEMSIRISQRLAKWAVCAEDELRRELDELQKPTIPTPKQLEEARRLFARVLSCPGGMRIHTIHAFGQEILRRFPVEAGLPPHFEVLEEIEARAIMAKAQSDVLKIAASAPDSVEGKALRVLAGELGEERFADILRELAQDAQRFDNAIAKAGSLKNLITEMRNLLDLGPKETENSIRHDAAHNCNFSYDKVLWAARILRDKGSRDFKKRGEIILNWLALPQNKRAASLENYFDAFFTQKGKPFDKKANDNLLQKYTDLENIISHEVSRLEKIKKRLDSLRIAEQTKAILTLAMALNKRYAVRKTAEAVLDYDDLIRKTDELLSRKGIAEWVLYKLDGGIDHILVDEAQDTSPAQWRIISALADEFFAGRGARDDYNRTLFVVGDEKQSIFSFLKADPDEFERMRKYFQKRIIEAKRDYREVPLNISFRSAPAILRAVDTVFAAEVVQRGVSHTEVRHQAWHREATGRVEVWPLVPAQKKEKAEWELPLEYESGNDPAAELAAKIAATIEKWQRENITVFDRDSGQNRPITYSDIMVLVRKRSPFVDHLVREMKQRKIPVTGADRMLLTKQLAVMDLVAILQFTLLPEDDLNLATVLRGPLLSCSEEQLMELAIGRDGTLWQSLAEKARKSEILAAMHSYLKEQLAMADEITAFSMLMRLLNRPCPADDVSGKRALWKRLGPDALDPIDELLNAAQQFGMRHTPSLQAFLHWLMQTEAEIKREMDPGAGQVRICTVHGAKGLEAPIIILPDTTAPPRKNDLQKIIWHTEHNIPFYIPREPQNAMLRRLRDTARQKQMEEYRRLLYVAMTRAADRLYICGWEPGKKDGFEESWYSLVKRALKPLNEPHAAPTESIFEPEIVLADPEFPVKEATFGVDKKEFLFEPLPKWARSSPAPEPVPPRPLTPSRPDEDEPPLLTPQDVRFARGRIIHLLLQNLPGLESSKQEEVARRFLSNPQNNLTPEQQEDIISEVLTILSHPDYRLMFGTYSRAEVPVIGVVGNHVVAGQVDRLCVLEKEVWIVDYKTNRLHPRSPDEISPVYLKQLGAYRAVLSKIYPDKSVRAFILWTEKPLLMPIPDRLLYVS